jgi:hypothetical protein
MHKHRWEPYLRNIVAYYSKRTGEEDAIWVEGDSFRCLDPKCDEYLFKPNDKNLSPVEVELTFNSQNNPN